VQQRNPANRQALMRNPANKRQAPKRNSANSKRQEPKRNPATCQLVKDKLL
jgi:hypothetical protein